MSDDKNLPNMSAAFRTTEVLGGDRPRYQMVFKFPTIEAMYAADEEWRAFRKKTEQAVACASMCEACWEWDRCMREPWPANTAATKTEDHHD